MQNAQGCAILTTFYKTYKRQSFLRLNGIFRAERDKIFGSLAPRRSGLLRRAKRAGVSIRPRIITNNVSTREEMLRRVRGALGRDAGAAPSAASQPLPPLGRVMPEIPDLLDHFEAEFRAVAGVPHRVSSSESLREILASIVPVGSAVALSRHPVISDIGVSEALDDLGYVISRWPEAGEIDDPAMFKQRCFSAAAGITGVEFVLAESGTLVLSSAGGGAQIVSLAPPVHIAIYRAGQIVESLEEALAGLAKSGGPDASADAAALRPNGRSIVFVTGTSRTADIEQISIRGVHGPTQVHAILMP